MKNENAIEAIEKPTTEEISSELALVQYLGIQTYIETLSYLVK